MAQATLWVLLRQAKNHPSAFNTAANWAPAAVIANGDWIILGGNHRIDVDIADLTLLGLDVLGQAANKGLSVNQNLTIGSIGDSGGGGAVIKATIVAGKTLTLNGTAFGGGGGIAVNVYDKLGDIDFGAGGTLAINSTNRGVIQLDGAFLNGANSTINVTTDLIATNAANAAKTALSVKNINIGTAGAAANLTMQPNGNAAVTISGDVRFLHQDSTLTLDSANAGGPAAFNVNGGSIGGGVVADDNKGIVVLNANGQDLTLAKAGAETLGKADNIRLKQVKITGANAATINTQVFAKEIELNGTGNATFGAAVNTGADGQIKFTAVNPTSTIQYWQHNFYWSTCWNFNL